MRKLQDAIISLMIHMIILFNIERLDINTRNAIDLETSLYVLSTTAIVLILSVKWLSSLRQPVLLSVAAGIFFLVVQAFFV